MDAELKKADAIPLITTADNHNDNLPVFARSYGGDELTPFLHRHQMIQINYVAEGGVLHEYAGQSERLEAGTVAVIPLHVVHRFTANSARPVKIVELEFVPEFVLGRAVSLEAAESYFDFAYLEPFLSETRGRRLHGANRLAVEQLLAEVLAEYRDRQEGYLPAIKACLLKLLVLLGRLYRREAADDGGRQMFEEHREALQRVLRHIDGHYAEPLRVEEMARMAILSRSYFCNLFKRMTGCTFVEYVNRKRIQKACEMLEDRGAAIPEVAQRAGFRSASQFNRLFKALTGCSPSRYRALYVGRPREGSAGKGAEA
ncbi:MAG: AraC family transcriptional regulator [Eubacteriales bacterium]|nr:AraC family transcriptional regulator [Eubacteriales bacterium]